MNHLLTCDGVTVINGTATTGTVSVPRQSAGGAYTWVYSDERGQRTTLMVLVPLGRFVMISPVANDALPIPRPGSQPAVAPSVVPPSPGANALATTPSITAPPTPDSPIAALMIHYAVPIIPDGIVATFHASAICDRSAPDYCGSVPGPALPATGTYSLSDTYAHFNNGFEAFTPGQGELDVTFQMDWQIQASGFNVAVVRLCGCANNKTSRSPGRHNRASRPCI